jgi:two-component system, OmpR family, phosphate regulon sensor histidine kinase PhoR
MNKRVIFLLGAVMSFAILCLILVQIYWIKEAFHVKEKQFDQLVLKALSEMAYKIEQDETYQLIINEFYAPGNRTNVNEFLNTTLDSNKIKLPFSKSANSNKIKDNSSTPVHVPNSGQKSHSIEDDLAEKKRYIDQVLLKMISQSPDITERIKPGDLEYIINATLSDYDIDLKFEYAVTRKSTITAYKSAHFKPESIASVFRTKLYPDDFYGEENYLLIYFPDKRKYIIQSLGLMGVTSAVLTVLILFTFGLTLFVIFRQKKLSEITGDFVSNMTHELKTPISTISLASQMLGDTSIPDKLKNVGRISDIISQESKRLGNQVEKVLQMATIDKGKLSLKLTLIDIHELIEAVSGNFMLQVENKGGLLIPSLHAEESKVMADSMHMTNVISNLLDNAVKYTLKSPEIYIETHNRNGFVEISVKDNGIGISKTNQKRVFDKFFRVSTGNVHNVKGFGLGLNYVKRIIEAHNGIVALESELGKGTSITFSLPLIDNIIS